MIQDCINLYRIKKTLYFRKGNAVSFLLFADFCQFFVFIVNFF